MKFHIYALTLGLGLVSLSGIVNAGNFYRTNRANALIEPFITAVKGGDLSVFDAYVKFRKITNFERITDAKYGMNPLHWAAALGHVHIIRYLIMHGADVNATTPKGLTALHLATFAGQTEAVKCLILEANCNINQRTTSGLLTALDLAKAQKNKNLEGFLARHQRVKTARFAMQLPRNLMNLSK